MIPSIENVVVTSYLVDSIFNRAVTAHIKADFFEAEESKEIMEISLDYTVRNQQPPTKTALITILENKSGISEKKFENTVELIERIFSDENKTDVTKTDYQWRLQETEKWCKERSVFLAITKSLEILDGKVIENKRKLDKSIIPELMQQALSISFDSTIGHDYLGEYEQRYEFMHSPVSKIPFRIPILNKITGGGLETKSLTILVCPPHAGKSLTMASWGADWLRDGHDVLVITLEMAEMKIAERIDANMLNVDIGDLKNIPHKNYQKKFEQFKTEGYGRLIVKEYPTSSAGASHFRFLLQELEIKQNFKPKIVIVDYMGICISSRFKSDNMYQIQKAVGEELRGLAQEKDFALVTAVQTNKNGYSGSDFDMGDISESSGHAMTGDFILGLISTDDLIKLGQVRVKQLKNRWGSIHDIPSFLLNMDRKKMKVYEDSSYTEHIKKVESEAYTKPSNQVESNEEDQPFVFKKEMIRPINKPNSSGFIF